MDVQNCFLTNKVDDSHKTRYNTEVNCLSFSI